MTEDFNELDQKISDYKSKYLTKKTEVTPHKSGPYIITELTVSICVGAFIGYYLDIFFSSKVFTFIVRNLLI